MPEAIGGHGQGTARPLWARFGALLGIVVAPVGGICLIACLAMGWAMAETMPSALQKPLYISALAQDCDWNNIAIQAFGLC